jgi:anti-sigma regulatory factor (Ser/Thr protein kinase)
MPAMTVLGSLTLPGVRRSVAHARRFLRDLLGAHHPALDDTELCTSEVVTNSVVHSDSGRGGHVTIVAAEDGAQIVQVTVINDGTGGVPLASAPPDAEAEDGRGLVIVGELADAWGVDVIDGRTAVWFRIAPQ